MTFEQSIRQYTIEVGTFSNQDRYLGERDASIYARALCHPTTNALAAYVDTDGIFKNAAGNPFGAIGNLTLAQVLVGGDDAGGGVITGLGAPSAASDAATKGYTDAALLSLRNRTRVRVATTANVTLATVIAGSTLDGATVADGDLVLIKNQSSPAENGIYVAAVSGAPSRSSQFDTFSEFAGLLCAVEEGTNNGDSIWLCTSNETGTIGVTALNFSKVSVFAGARFTDSAARAATTPDFVGQEGYQIDTGEYYFADGTTAGDWGKGMRFAVSPVIASSDGLYLLNNGPVRFVDSNTINAWTLNAAGALSGSSTLPSSSGVLALQSATPISAREYGALGDGVNDDTAELQAAIAASNTQKRPLYIPPGTYNITSALNVPSNGSHISGSGGDRTVIRQLTS